MEYLIILLIPLVWLLFESDCMTVRLPIGKATPAEKPIAENEPTRDELVECGLVPDEYDCLLEAQEYAKRFN